MSEAYCVFKNSRAYPVKARLPDTQPVYARSKKTVGSKGTIRVGEGSVHPDGTVAVWLDPPGAIAAGVQSAPKPEQQPCSVYFMGADSTGKSELVKYVARAYGMRKVPETARSVLHEEGYTLHSLRVRSMDADEYQRMVFDRQIAQEAATPRPFVADRGLDNLAYASEYGRCFGELAAREEVQKYVEAQRADVVFLVRPHRALRAEDGVRVLPSWEEQQRLDAKIELLLQLWGVPHVVIAENSAARREEQIDWCLAARGFTKHG